MKCSLILFFALLIHSTNAQDLSKHQWNERILLVISEDSENEELPISYLDQLKELDKNSDGLSERKMVIYFIFPNKYRSVNARNHAETDWIQSDSLLNTYNPEKAPFKVILIGLDGSIKETRIDLFPSQELFSIIDGMSMRQAELKRKN